MINVNPISPQVIAVLQLRSVQHLTPTKRTGLEKPAQEPPQDSKPSYSRSDCEKELSTYSNLGTDGYSQIITSRRLCIIEKGSPIEISALTREPVHHLKIIA